MARRSVYSQLERAFKAKQYDKARILAQQIVFEHEEKNYFGSEVISDYRKWARAARELKDYALEVEIIERYLRRQLDENPEAGESAQVCDMQDLLESARDRLRRYVPEPGTCEMCGASKKKLTRIESGDCVCSTCLREFGPAKFKVPTKTRQQLERCGLILSKHPTREEVDHLKGIAARRDIGVPDNASEYEYRRHCAPKPKEFRTRVAGTRYYQWNVERCLMNQKLQLIREPDNPYDPFAVMVCTTSRDQIGHLSARVVGDGSGLGWSVADDLDAGSDYEAYIDEIDGVPGALGLLIRVRIEVPPSTWEHFERWVNEVGE